MATEKTPFLEESLPFGKLYVEYGGFLTNHRAQGLVALRRLGADDAKLAAFCGWYNERLEPADGATCASQAAPSQLSVPQLLGLRRNFADVLEHFRRRLAVTYGGSVEGAVRGELPALVGGLAASLLHGIIQLGYGVAGNSPDMVCEGLAYLHHSYVPLTLSPAAPALETLGAGVLDVLDVVRQVGADASLRRYMMEEYKKEWVASRKTSWFQHRMVVLLTHRGDRVAEYVHQIRVPELAAAASSSSPGPRSPSPEQIEAVLKWMVDSAVVLYQAADNRNDFVLIHGVTSSWALLQTLPLVSAPRTAMEAIRVQLALLLIVYVARNAPPLRLERLQEPEVAEVTWEEIKRCAVAMETAGTDEHTYKLVQVCGDMAARYPDSVMGHVYKRAALSAITAPMYKGFEEE